MKIPVQTSSCIAAAFCWVIFSILTIFILGSMRDRARLIRDNDNERLLNIIFTALRGHDDFGSAIESNPMLAERIAGFAIYGDDLAVIYNWGTVPHILDETLLVNQSQSRLGRYTIPDRKGDRVKFVLNTDRISPLPNTAERMPPAAPLGERVTPPAAPARRYNEPERQRRTRQDFFLFNFNILASGKYLYIDIAHPVYWRTQTLTAVLFPFCELVLLGVVFYIRHIYLRYSEYRDRIEAQKNLVVLGTAASTLAHEIKNPLLSIRIQTSIVKKLFPNTIDEVTIIDEEVERISALIYRVNDYLRDAEGSKIPINSYDIVAETSQRLCGRNILQDNAVKEAMIFMDENRARSVFENLIRNALESGGLEEAVGASIIRTTGFIIISIFDRGKGISKTDLKRIFDPFVTTKSTGMGIGLSISKRFIEAAQGSIKLENRTEGGTIVQITLPEYNKEFS